jgi:hypothetical protein
MQWTSAASLCHFFLRSFFSSFLFICFCLTIFYKPTFVFFSFFSAVLSFFHFYLFSYLLLHLHIYVFLSCFCLMIFSFFIFNFSPSLFTHLVHLFLRFLFHHYTIFLHLNLPIQIHSLSCFLIPLPHFTLLASISRFCKLQIFPHQNSVSISRLHYPSYIPSKL